MLQALGVDYVDESEVLTPADYAHHIDKWQFTVPFVCGATNLGEALRRLAEGAAMIRSKGEAGTGDVSNAVTHMRTIRAEIRRLTSLAEDELYVAAKELQAPYELVAEVARRGTLPVVLFTAGGIATPADAAMMMQLGADGVFVGSGIFKSRRSRRGPRPSSRPPRFFDDRTARQGLRGLGEAMVGNHVADVPVGHRLATAGLGPEAVAPLGVLALQVTCASTCARWTPSVRVAFPYAADGARRCDGLVLPGGESTTIVKLQRRSTCSNRCDPQSRRACRDRLLRRHDRSRRLVDAPPGQPTIGGLEVTVRRKRVRPPGRFVRDRSRLLRARRPAPARGLHPGTVGRISGPRGRRAGPRRRDSPLAGRR